MKEELNIFTHIGVKKLTQKKISLLAQVANGGQRMHIYDLVDAWADGAWEEAKQAGVVTDAMLNPPAHWVNPIVAAETAPKGETQLKVRTKKRSHRLGRTN